MKMVKSLLLVSAAGLVAVVRSTGRRSSRKGQAGRIREGLLPVRRWVLLHPRHRYLHEDRRLRPLPGQTSAPAPTSPAVRSAALAVVNNRDRPSQTSPRARAPLLTVDTRQQTAYGTLRTYMLLGFSQDIAPSAPTTAPRPCTSTRGFIQIAGFTFGKATSYFDFVSTAAVAYNAGITALVGHRRRGHSRGCLHRAARQRSVGHDLGRAGA